MHPNPKKPTSDSPPGEQATSQNLALQATPPERLATFLDEREQRIRADYEWCLHDPEVRRQYSGQVVVVQNRKIWGVGNNHATALNAALARPDCPFCETTCPSREAIVVVPGSLAPPVSQSNALE